MVDYQKIIEGRFTLPWHYTHVSELELQNSMRAYTYCHCLMCAHKTGGYTKYYFYADDGHRFSTEQKLIKYMDKKHGIIHKSRRSR